jgi:hypothetical protein
MMSIDDDDSAAPASPKGGRPVLAALLLALGAAIILITVHRHRPIGGWLFWTYGQVAFLAALFCAACAGVGLRLLPLFSAHRLAWRERSLLAVALGVVVFALGVQGLGLCGLLGPVVFFAWPLALIALGWSPLRRTVRGHLRLARAAMGAPGARSIARTGAWLLGLAGLVLVYLAIMTPENISYDGRWYHMGLAEEYLVRGQIAPSVERAYVAALPQLATTLYTWAFLLPGASSFVRIELAAHVEFALFLLTLAGIPCLLRRALPGARIAHAWAAVFFFPGILLYDSSLCGGADHVAAFWAIPMVLALWRTLREWTVRSCLLLATFATAAILTKYQMVYLVLPVVLTLLFTAARRSLDAGRSRGLRAALAVWWALGLGAVWGLALSAAHFLKNWIWYGDPVFPILGRLLRGQGWNPFADINGSLWVTQGSLLHRLWESLQAVFTFAFVPHDWPRFHGDLPVFGFLFTVTMVALPTLRAPRRVWHLFAMAAAGVFIWFFTNHQDRYLQMLLPIMVTATVAGLALAWRMGPGARTSVRILVGVQLVWGASLFALPGHTMAGRAPVQATIDLLGNAMRGEVGQPMASYRGLDRISEILPRQARVLLHEVGPRLGLEREVVSDALPRQAAIDYVRLTSTAAAWRLLRQLGVTHLVWQTGISDGGDSFAAELRFFDLAVGYGEGPRTVGAFTVARLPETPPPAPDAAEKVAYLPCVRHHQPGLYGWRDLDLPGLSGPLVSAEPLRSLEPADVEALMAKARYLVRDTRCPSPPIPSSLTERWVRAATRTGIDLFVPVPSARAN